MSKYQIETTTPDGKPIIVPIPDGFLDQIRDEYAHELAEKIRAEVRQFKADEILEPDKDWTASGAADLIDPKVTQS